MLGVVFLLLVALLIYNNWPTGGPSVTVSPEMAYLAEPLRQTGEASSRTVDTP